MFTLAIGRSHAGQNNCPDRPTQFWHMPLALMSCEVSIAGTCAFQSSPCTTPTPWSSAGSKYAGQFLGNFSIVFVPAAGRKNVHPIPDDISPFSADSKWTTVILSLSIWLSVIELIACETDIRKRKAR